MPFKIESLAIPDVKLVQPPVFPDQRGFFQESYKQSAFSAAGLPEQFVQDNLSHSNKGVLRGLHYQENPYAQGKLVQVIRGRIFDVAVDIRPHSHTFGQWVAHELSGDNHYMLWIPEGFAHGFLVLEDDTYFCYKCTREYHPASERAILWNDPNIGIVWPSYADLVLSEKDKNAVPLETLVCE